MGWIRIEIETEILAQSLGTERQTQGIIEMMSNKFYWIGGDGLFYAVIAKTKLLAVPIVLFFHLNTTFLILHFFLIISSLRGGGERNTVWPPLNKPK